MAAGVDVELLGEQPERGLHVEQALHEVARALVLADDRQRRHEPERADEERPLLARQAVVGLAGPVAQHEAVLGQLVGDREHARPQAGVVAWEEAEDRGEQRRGVERVGRVVLAQDAAGVDAVLEDVGLDLVGDAAPGRDEVAVGPQIGELRRAVHRDPAHELRRDVVLRRAARLPDALVGLAPDGRRAVGLRLHDRPQAPGEALAAPACGAGSSRAPRRRRRSGAGRTRRCRSGPAGRRRTP